MYAVQRLAVLVGDSDGKHLLREYLVRRAAILDRLADDVIADPADVADIVHDAVHYARTLREHDLQTGATHGNIPASDPHWDEDPRGYSQQEHRAWVIAHDVP
ncbi:hypothetical protein AB0901_30880 [Streptomyces roseifaciens]